MAKSSGNEQTNGAKSGDSFSRGGFILAAIGSAVGLGNMWKFPYITGIHGGAAFFLLFIVCLILVGLPVLLAELAIGRGGRGSVYSSLTKLSGSRWRGSLGFIAIAGSFFIMAYYAVVAGWTLHYAMLSFTGGLFHSGGYGDIFGNFVGSGMSVFWQFILMLISVSVLIKGVSGGIEKLNNYLIPSLVVLMLLLAAHALLHEGSGEGVAFFLEPDFGGLTAESVLVALGQAFFSMSLGMGIMMTYGAYVDKRQSLGTATIAVAGGNALYALLAGLIIFPTVFIYGIEPGEGPGLVFIALPAAFAAMPFGSLIGGLFFVVLAFAALTSAVSILEVSVSFVHDYFRIGRRTSAMLVGLLCFLVGLPFGLSLGGDAQGWLVPGGRTLFDWAEFICSNVLLPVSGLINVWFAGYVWKQAAKEAALSPVMTRIWLGMLRYVVPVLILIVLLYAIGIIRF
ncbi:sodium-dependent transporter [Paenibacillus sp. strain BS8-2]